MSVFTSKSRETRPRPASSGPMVTTITVIAPGTKVVGDVQADGVLQVEGRIEGTISGKTRVYVTAGGEVQGDIQAEEIVVAGTVRGNLAAGDRAELQAGGTLHGDVTAPRVAVLEGGTLNGRLTMDKPPALQKRHAA